MCHKDGRRFEALAYLALSLSCVFYKELFFIKSFIMYSVRKRCVCVCVVSVVLLSRVFIYLCYFSNLRRITSSGNSRCGECYLFCSLHVLGVFPFQF